MIIQVLPTFSEDPTRDNWHKKPKNEICVYKGKITPFALIYEIWLKYKKKILIQDDHDYYWYLDIKNQ